MAAKAIADYRHVATIRESFNALGVLIFGTAPLIRDVCYLDIILFHCPPDADDGTWVLLH